MNNESIIVSAHTASRSWECRMKLVRLPVAHAYETCVFRLLLYPALSVSELKPIKNSGRNLKILCSLQLTLFHKS